MNASTTVIVYSFSLLSDVTADWVPAPHKASRDTIDRLGGKVLEGTGEDVEASSLDPDGVYRRVPTGWGFLR